MIGVAPAVFLAGPGLVNVALRNPIEILKRGTVKTYDLCISFLVGFWKIIKAQVSPKKIGGVISIGKIAKDHFKMGFVHFINIMGILSAYLFILNLLPIPLLDGGHLAFYFVEVIKGAPSRAEKNRDGSSGRLCVSYRAYGVCSL